MIATAWTDEAIALGYITPETLSDAIAASDRSPSAMACIVHEALWAMSDRLVEDWNLCAFVLADRIGDRTMAGRTAARAATARAKAELSKMTRTK